MGIELHLHCNYHRAKGHHIDDCFMLSRDMEALIQRGFLNKYLTKRNRYRSPTRMQELSPPPPLPLMGHHV